MHFNHPEATQQAMNILRSGENFQWYVIPLLVIVLYVYANEYEKGSYRNIAGGLALYMVHWFVEIINALIQHFSGHALWTVPAGTAFAIMVGVGIEISLMFSIAGIVVCKLMPKDPSWRILGINNRLVFTVANAAFASILEIFLVRTPTFVWVYDWWGAFPVFVTVYIPFLQRRVMFTTGSPDRKNFHWLPFCRQRNRIYFVCRNFKMDLIGRHAR